MLLPLLEFVKELYFFRLEENVKQVAIFTSYTGYEQMNCLSYLIIYEAIYHHKSSFYS